MITSSDIDEILGDDFEGDRWISPPSWRKEAADWEPVEYADELSYDVINEGRTVKTGDILIEGVEEGGVHHDGGEIYQVIRVTVGDEVEHFVRFGYYSSWDVNSFEDEWAPGEPYEYTETRWRKR